MPKIAAPTVAEHRRQQERAILSGARELLAETGQAPSLAAVGQKVGLARSSIYQYFASSEALLSAVIADLFPAWARRVSEKVAAESTPGARIWAYIEANLELFASSEQAVANVLARVVDPSLFREPMEQFHRELQQPLVEALRDHGEPRPNDVAELIDSLIVHACRLSPSTPAVETGHVPSDEAADTLRRLLGGYLGSEQG